MTTYSFDYIDGGRNIGSHPFRDPTNHQFAYTLRETNPAHSNQGAAINMVKVNVETGELVTSGTAYDYASNLGALGACFVNGGTTAITWDTNVTGGMSSGSTLYIAADDFNLDFTHNSTIVEFDKTTLAVTQSWTNGLSETLSRGRGTSVMDAAGTYFANGGNNLFSAGLLTDCKIQLLKPSNSDYGYVSLLALIGSKVTLNLPEPFNSPICFDSGGHLWFVAQPITTITGVDYVSGKSRIYKCTVSGSPTISLTVVNSWEIADNYHAYGANDFSQFFSYKRISFDTSNSKIYLWSAYKTTGSAEYAEGWFLEWDTVGETFTRGPLTWTAGSITQQRAMYDLVGWTGGIDSLVILKNVNTTPAFSFFNIAAGTETSLPVIATWTYTGLTGNEFNNSTYVYSQGSFEIYAFDTGYVEIDVSHETYKDTLYLAHSNPPFGGSGRRFVANLGPVHVLT